MIHASGRHIGCDENLLNATSESADDICSLVNSQVTTQQCHSMAILGHLLTQPWSCPLRLNTDELYKITHRTYYTTCSYTICHGQNYTRQGQLGEYFALHCTVYNTNVVSHVNWTQSLLKRVLARHSVEKSFLNKPNPVDFISIGFSRVKPTG